MKKPVLLGAAVLLYGALQAQCVLPSTESDSLFPVTNKPGASVYHIAADKGTYYLMGNFTNLVQNQGPALVVDTATNAVRTPRKWRVDGTVTAAVDDGRGGYFLAGNFSRIGDSVRRYLAQIDAQGQPTAWNPQPDEAVKALHRKGDTLFMAGAFSSVFRQHRENLALYSLSGDSLLRIAGPNQPSLRMSVINCFVVHNDTLIYGGDGSWGDHSLRKFNLKDNQVLPWTLAYTEYGPVTSLQLSSDSVTIVYVSNYNSDHIMGADARTGAELYRIEVDMAPVSGMGPGYVPGLKVVGDKAYAVGYFEQVVSHYSKLSRKGFFAFNPRTGVILQDDLKSDGYLSFLHPSGGRLFVSGDFTRVSGVGRNNFAVVDTGTLAVGPWQLAPSDALTALAFSGGACFRRRPLQRGQRSAPKRLCRHRLGYQRYIALEPRQPGLYRRPKGAGTGRQPLCTGHHRPAQFVHDQRFQHGPARHQPEGRCGAQRFFARLFPDQRHVDR